MTDKTFYSMWGLQNDLAEMIDELIDSNPDMSQDDMQDQLYDMVDSVIPVYNYDLAMLLADKPSLGYYDSFSHTYDNMFQAIGAAVYEDLAEFASEYLYNNYKGADDV